jgi:hypothetical protein
MSNHTPGPWEIKRHFDPGYKNISAQKHTALAQVVWCMEDEDRSPSCEANAHLIAAAPELLEALEALVLDESKEYIPTRLWDVARSAIAKAKGHDNE